MTVEHQILELGDFAIQKGSVLPDAKLGYATLGELNPARDNAVLCPAWFTATPSDVAQWMTGEDRALDPRRYFIILPNHFGAADNVVAQHRLVTEHLCVERLRLVSSWSLGAAQTYAWAALHPELVQAAAPISGAARTFSEPFYREEIWRCFGAADVEQFIDIFWDAFYLKNDANDLLAQIWTWWNGDLGDHPGFGGSFEQALASITARTIILNGTLDQYFPPVDSDYEAQHIPNGESRPIPGIWGHMAPFNPDDQAFIDTALRELLEEGTA